MSAEHRTNPDFLDEMIAKRSARSSAFPDLLDAALQKRGAAPLREHAREQDDPLRPRPERT